MLTSTDPAHGYQILGRVNISSDTDINKAVGKARTVFPRWLALGVKGRVEAVRRLKNVIEQNKEQCAQGMTHEMGMPIKEARSTVDWSLVHINWYIDNAESCLAPETTFENATQIHQTHYEPYGVTAVIVPWNFPLANFVMGCIQPLLAGNTIVFKMSEEVPMFGKLIDDLMAQAQMPSGVFNQVYGGGDVGEKLTRNAIDMICFTGSSAVGRKLCQIGAEKFIPVHLELGGSDAGIVCKDAAIDDLLEAIYAAKFINNGQICCGLKRLLVHEKRMDEVCKKLTKLVQSKKLGDPCDAATDLGPLVSKRQLDLLKAQVADAKDKGAKILTGGKEPIGLDGAYYEPTLITNISPNMRVWTEEVFGPVLPIVSFTSDDEALRLANDTPYGLSGYIYTNDKALAEKLAAGLQVGQVSHNGVDSSGPQNPFGGYKLSGMKRTGGKQGFHDACNVKTVCLVKN